MKFSIKEGGCRAVRRRLETKCENEGHAAAAVLERVFSATPGPSYWALRRTSPSTGARTVRPMGRPRCRKWAAAGGRGWCGGTGRGTPAVTPVERCLSGRLVSSQQHNLALTTKLVGWLSGRTSVSDRRTFTGRYTGPAADG